MILSAGETIHVIHRQLFQTDVRRHFIGKVEAFDDILVRATGYVFAADAKLNRFTRHGVPRTRIICLSTETLIINVVPEHVDIEKVTYNYVSGDKTTVTDGSDWHLDLTHL